MFSPMSPDFPPGFQQPSNTQPAVASPKSPNPLQTTHSGLQFSPSPLGPLSRLSQETPPGFPSLALTADGSANYNGPTFGSGLMQNLDLHEPFFANTDFLQLGLKTTAEANPSPPVDQDTPLQCSPIHLQKKRKTQDGLDLNLDINKLSITPKTGKEVLLKAVIQAIPTFIMSTFLLPKKIIKRMNQLLRKFFWSGSMDKQSIHWCNAETLCAPKAVGGLGFRDFRYFNLALVVGKQAWRILECPEALWVRLLKSLYFPSTDFLSSVKGPRPFWIWSSLCEARPLLSLGAFKALGDGNNIRIRSDPWLPNIPNMMFDGPSGPYQYVSEWILTNPRVQRISFERGGGSST
ncbi:Uncharacterized mitochondrial protein AtMg00310 [Linum perenne]